MMIGRGKKRYQRRQGRFPISIQADFTELWNWFTQQFQPPQRHCQRMLKTLQLFCAAFPEWHILCKIEHVWYVPSHRKGTLIARHAYSPKKPINSDAFWHRNGVSLIPQKTGTFRHRNGARMTVGLWRRRVGAELFLIGHILPYRTIVFPPIVEIVFSPIERLYFLLL